MPLPVNVVLWGFPKIRGTILGVPIIRIIVFWGLYWGPLILGNYHIGLCFQVVVLMRFVLTLQLREAASPQEPNERVVDLPNVRALFEYKALLAL